MPDTASPVPDFTKWPSFPFEGDLRVKHLDPPVDKEPARKGEDAADCSACNAPDEAYIWVSERWRVRAMDRPTGLPMVLILESRSHLDLGDLPNLLAAELGVMTVRLERAVRSLDGVARVHVNRWGDGSAHLHMWFLARPYGRLQLRGTFLSLWDDILPPIPESTWRENLALVAAWLAEFGGKPLAEPPRIEWQAPSSLVQQAEAEAASLALQADADDASVALVEAPVDEATGDAPNNGTAAGGASTAEAPASDRQADNTAARDRAAGETTAARETPAARETTAAGDTTAAGGTTAAGQDARAEDHMADSTKPAIPSQATAPAAGANGDAKEADPAAEGEDAEAATVDLARQGAASPAARAVPAARTGETQAQGSKPEHQGAPT